jgi:hypothetical protein
MRTVKTGDIIALSLTASAFRELKTISGVFLCCEGLRLVNVNKNELGYVEQNVQVSCKMHFRVGVLKIRQRCGHAALPLIFPLPTYSSDYL